jgi:predicted N-acetyltransferase YhbS
MADSCIMGTDPRGRREGSVTQLVHLVFHFVSVLPPGGNGSGQVRVSHKTHVQLVQLLGYAPVAPEYQRRGVGKALIQEGLSRLRTLGAAGCCLVGHPDYYKKFGFKNVSGLVHEGVPQEVFFALPFDGHIPQGNVVFHEGFKADGQLGDAADDTGRAPSKVVH